MSDRDADLAVADDAESEGRHDIAAELRARHLSSEEQLVEEYRVRLGLLPWAQHAAQARQMVIDYGRRTGRTTRALLTAIARCETDEIDLLMVVGSDRVRDHCSFGAREMLHRLGFGELVVVRTASDRSPHLLLGLRPHVVYRDHADIERAVARPPRGRPRHFEVCPVCNNAAVLRAIVTGREACADPACAAAHGFRWDVLYERTGARRVVIVADVDGEFRGRVARVP